MVTVIIPTYNAERYLRTLLLKLSEQTLPHRLIIIDSDSSDSTKEIVIDHKVELIQIEKASFNHGSTRNLGAKLANSEIIVFMTQDALPASSNTLECLVDALSSREDIALAYGRQLPYPNTKIFERFARMTNYPEISVVKNKNLIPEMGIKTCSCSNSFAAYKKNALLAVGGFPSNTVLGEDVSVAARLILTGKSIAYAAEAEVFHSHDYTVGEEFKRYFDIGAFHREEREILSNFSKAESEGFRYVLQEWSYLRQNDQLISIPMQLLRTFAKYTGYKLGIWQKYIPNYLKRKISMHSSFWML